MEFNRFPGVDLENLSAIRTFDHTIMYHNIVNALLYNIITVEIPDDLSLRIILYTYRCTMCVLYK